MDDEYCFSDLYYEENEVNTIEITKFRHDNDDNSYYLNTDNILVNNFEKHYITCVELIFEVNEYYEDLTEYTKKYTTNIISCMHNISNRRDIIQKDNNIKITEYSNNIYGHIMNIICYSFIHIFDISIISKLISVNIKHIEKKYIKITNSITEYAYTNIEYVSVYNQTEEISCGYQIMLVVMIPAEKDIITMGDIVIKYEDCEIIMNNDEMNNIAIKRGFYWHICVPTVKSLSNDRIKKVIENKYCPKEWMDNNYAKTVYIYGIVSNISVQHITYDNYI